LAADVGQKVWAEYQARLRVKGEVRQRRLLYDQDEPG
jgi:hypothetical protein